MSTGSHASIRGRTAGLDTPGGSGKPSSMGSEGGRGACPTCDALRSQYAEHDAWVASLKESAESVLMAHQRTRDALADMPGGDASPGTGQ